MDTHLAEQLRFTEEDLTANRQGYLSSRQQRFLRRGMITSASLLACAVVALLIGGFIIALDSLIWGGVLVFIGVSLAAYLYTDFKQKSDQLQENSVHVVDVSIQTVHDVYREGRFIETDKGRFRLRGPFKVDYEGKTYRLYVFKPELLLSAEELESDSSASP